MDNSILLAGIMLGILFLVGSGLAFLYYMNYERGSFITSSYVDSESMPRQLDLQGHDPNIACFVVNDLWKSVEEDGKSREYYALHEPLVKFLKSKKFKEVRTLDERGHLDSNWQGKLGKHPVTVYFQAGETGRKFELYLHHDRIMKVGDIKIYVPQEIRELGAKFKQEMVDAIMARATWEPEIVSRETTVYSLINERDGLGLTQMATSSLFKFGRVITECPPMFSLNVKASFNGTKIEKFNLKGVAEFVCLALTKTDSPLSGIFFGAPGLGKSSLADALAWYAGRDPRLMVIRVNGPAIADANQTATLLTLIKSENERGRKPVIIIDEADSHLELTSTGGKSEKAAALMSLMNEVSVFATCNKEENQIHPAFLREGRGNLQIHLNPLEPSQLPVINDYIKKRAEGDKELIFTPWVGKGIPTLAQLWAQLQHKSITNMLAGKWAELEKDVQEEHAADVDASEPADNDWDKVSTSESPAVLPLQESEIRHSRNPNRRRR
jgi:hypothetical protein